MTELVMANSGGIGERLLARDCAGCGTPVTLSGRGRPRSYCSQACRQRAWALRTAEKQLAQGQDPRPQVVREVVERVTPVASDDTRTGSLDARNSADRVAAGAVPATTRDWVTQLHMLAEQLLDQDHPLAREHVQHRLLYTGLIHAVAALGAAHADLDQPAGTDDTNPDDETVPRQVQHEIDEDLDRLADPVPDDYTGPR